MNDSYNSHCVHETPGSMVLSKMPIYHHEMANTGNYVLGKQEKMRAPHLQITVYINVHCKEEVLTTSKYQDELNAVILYQP